MSALQPGCSAPDFSGVALKDGDFKNISPEDYIGKKYVYILFYPLDFTFVCPTELTAFSDAMSKFAALDCEVIGCSTDSHFSHLAWSNQERKDGGIGKLNFPLLADKNMEIARKYGVLKPDDGIAYRGLFLIDKKGKIRHMLVNDLPIGRSVDEAIRVLQAVEFFEAHGEVCPANWRPKDKTIKPNPAGSKDYFKSVN